MKCLISVCGYAIMYSLLLALFLWVASHHHSSECSCASKAIPRPYKQLDDMQCNNVPKHRGQASVWSIVAVIASPFHQLLQAYMYLSPGL